MKEEKRLCLVMDNDDEIGISFIPDSMRLQFELPQQRSIIVCAIMSSKYFPAFYLFEVLK